MAFISHATPLYEFLRLCNSTGLQKKVLDCGAGGQQPPLYLFHLYGYKTFGIDINPHSVKAAEKFSKDHNVDLNIKIGDMRNLEFDDKSFSFVYSYNTIMHLSKKGISTAMKEIERILVLDGLCYINFMSEDSQIGDRGEKIGEGEYLLPISGEESELHTFYADDEGDKYFKNFEIVHKEKRMVYRYKKGELQFILGEIGYIAKKLE